MQLRTCDIGLIKEYKKNLDLLLNRIPDLERGLNIQSDVTGFFPSIINDVKALEDKIKRVIDNTHKLKQQFRDELVNNNLDIDKETNVESDDDNELIADEAYYDFENSEPNVMNNLKKITEKCKIVLDEALDLDLEIQRLVQVSFIKCQSCKINILKENWLIHEASCLRHKTNCSSCGETIENSKITEHIQGHSLVSCIQCKNDFELGCIIDHEKNSCPKRPTQCKYCLQYFKCQELCSTHEVMCMTKTEECVKCKIYVRRDNIVKRDPIHNCELSNDYSTYFPVYEKLIKGEPEKILTCKWCKKKFVNQYLRYHSKVCDQSIFKEENELTDNQFGEMNDFKELDNILPLIQYREYDQNNPKNIKRTIKVPLDGELPDEACHLPIEKQLKIEIN